jgi:hypothetical protein
MLPIFPTAYFGSIAYFKALCSFEKVLIEYQETYPKQTLRNRTIINTANGHLRLSVAVEKPNGSKSITGEILLSDVTKWRAEHWRAIKTAYSSSPYFDHFGVEVKELIYSEVNNLTNLNHVITSRILKWLDITLDLQQTTSYETQESMDYRNKLKPTESSRPPYIQVFDKEPYNESLSILDAIFCKGPMARTLILN